MKIGESLAVAYIFPIYTQFIVAGSVILPSTLQTGFFSVISPFLPSVL